MNIHRRIVAFTGCCVLLFLLLTVAAGFFTRPATAGNQRAITIHDGADTLTISTDAKSIGEVLKKADVRLGENDAVEPSKETPLLAPAYNVNVYRARPVTIVDGQNRSQVMSPYQSARSIISHAGSKVYDEDIVEMQRIDDFMSEGTPGLKVDITRAKPVTMVLYGKATPVRTQATTVGGLMKEKNVTLGKDDGTSVPVTTPITAGMTFDVYRNGVQTKTEEKAVPFETQTVQDADREQGYKEVKEKGEEGKKTVTFEVNLKNGKEVSRKEIQSVVTKQPKKQVMIVGAKRKSLGGLEASFAALRQCEAGGVYSRNSGNGYYGAYQYDVSTWANHGGYRLPSDAPPAVQDAKAMETYQRRGWSPWPACSAKLGL